MKKLLKKILFVDEDLMGINQRNLDYVYPHNPRKYFPLANDKVISKSILEENKIPVPETYAIVNELWEIDDILKSIVPLQELVIKPANGSGGGGILILLKKEDDLWHTPSGDKYTRERLRHHLASILYGAFSIGEKDRAIIEYCIKPHSFLKEIYQQGVPDFRVIVFQNVPLMAMLRIPTDKSGGKANLHQGAMGIGIDMEKGMLLNGFYKNKYVDKHPDSGSEFSGKDIPFWEKTVALAVETSKLFPLKYLGIDIILDEQCGPMVIEVNVRPGLQIQNINHMGLNKTLRQKFWEENAEKDN